MRKKAMALLAVAVALAGLAGCNSVFSTTSSASHVVYVTVPSLGVAAFRVDNSSGNSTTILGSPYATGNSPFSIQVHPNKQFLYVTNSADNTISLFKIDGSSGALNEVLPRTSTGLSPQSLVMDSAGGFLFVSNNGSNNISVYSINASNGALTELSGSPFPTYTHPNALTLSPGGELLYVLDTNLGLVAAYTISSGTLTASATSPVGTAPFAVAIDPAEHFMYVTNEGAGITGTGTVSVFAIDSSSGTLTAVPDSTFPTGTNPVAALVHPNGTYLYVANSGSANISQFSIDSTTGLLTELSTPTASSGSGPLFMAFDPTTGWVDVGNQTSKNVTQFKPNLASGVAVPGNLVAVNTLDASDPPTAVAFGK